jgi:hypothetical protein
MPWLKLIVGLAPGIAREHDMDRLRVRRRPETRRDLAVAQPPRHAGQGSQMRGIVSIGAQQQEHEIGGDVVGRAEVLRRLETHESADGPSEARNRGMGDRDAASKAEGGRLAALLNRAADSIAIQGGFRNREANDFANNLPDVTGTQARNHACRGNQ